MPPKRAQPHENESFNIKRFDIRKMPRNATCLVYGKRRSGKSVLVRDLMYAHKDIPRGIVISQSEASSPFYQKFIPKSYIFDSYKTEILHRLFIGQETLVEREGGPKESNNFFIIMDDVLSDVQMWKRDNTLRKCMFNGRHINLMLVVVMQYCLALPPDMRCNFDYIFIFKDIIPANRKRLYEHFAGIVPTRAIFDKLMDKVTNDHGCLIIDMTGNSNSWLDCVFWYKAKLRDKFSVGCDEYWRMHDIHYKDFQGHADDEEEDPSEKDDDRDNSSPFKIVLRPMPSS